MTPNTAPSWRLSSQAGCLSRFLCCVTALSLLALQSAPSPLPLAVLSPHHHPPRLIPTSLPTSHFITAVTIPSSPSSFTPILPPHRRSPNHPLSQLNSTILPPHLRNPTSSLSSPLHHWHPSTSPPPPHLITNLPLHHHPPSHHQPPTSSPSSPSHHHTLISSPSSPSHHHPPISSPTFHLITILPSHHHPHISSPSSPPPPHSLSTTTCSPLALLAPWTPLPPPGLLLLLSSSTVTYKAH